MNIFRCIFEKIYQTTANHREARLRRELNERLSVWGLDELMIFGSTEWIRDYLHENHIPFLFDHMMGEPYFHAKMTSAEFVQMRKAAEQKNDGTYVDIM